MHLTDSRTPGELLAGIPTPRNDGSPPKLDAGTVGRRANSSPAYRHRGTMGLPQSSTRGQSDARRTPRRHTDTAERWVSPKVRRGHGIVLGPAPADSPPAHRPSGAAGLPAPLTPHTTSSRRLNVGSSRAVSEGSDAGPASPRKAPRRPSPASGLPASQEVRPPYFLPSTQRTRTFANLLTSHPQSRHELSAMGPRFPATARSWRTWCTPT